MPFLYPLRNIKTMNVQVLNDKNKVIRTLATENNIEKIVISDPNEDGFRADLNWMWDGNVYNNGSYVPAPDGQYTIRTQSYIDYKGARLQNLDMKVKVDSVAPQVEVLHNVNGKEANNSYVIKFKAKDYGPCPTGVQGFLFALDDDIYTDPTTGKAVFEMKDMIVNEDGTYSKRLKNLPEGLNNITVIAVDYAGNGGMGDTVVSKKIFNEIGFYKDGNELKDWKQLPDGNFDLKFDINPKFMQNAAYAKIMLDGSTQKKIPINSAETAYSYSFKDVTPGEHAIEVKITDMYTNEIATWGYKVVVEDKDLLLSFEDLRSGIATNVTTFVAMGTVTAVPDKFTINDVNVEVDALSFAHPVKLEANKLNKIRVYAKKGDKEYNYAYNVYCDPDAPVINFDMEGAKENGEEVIVRVPADTKKYTVKGSVSDNAFGYTFYINADAVHNVFSEIPKEDVYNFEKEVELTANTTVVELEAVDQCRNRTTRLVKIIKEVKEGELKIEKLNMKDSYVNGEQFNGGVRVTNTIKQAKSASLIVGVFNDQNQMVNVAVANQIIGAGATVDLSTILMIPEQGKYTIKCFVWDSLDTMIPLSTVIQIPVLPAQNTKNGFEVKRAINPNVPLKLNAGDVIGNPKQTQPKQPISSDK